MKQKQTRAAESAAQVSEPEAADPLTGDPIAEIESIDPKELLAAAARVTREHPHAALAAAGLVGFLLGGGLTPRLLSTIAVIAGRRYASAALRDALAGAVREQLAAQPEA